MMWAEVALPISIESATWTLQPRGQHMIVSCTHTKLSNIVIDASGHVCIFTLLIVMLCFARQQHGKIYPVCMLFDLCCLHSTQTNEGVAEDEVLHDQAVGGTKGPAATSPQSAAPSPHEGLSHEQYKKLKRHKKKNQPGKSHMSEAQFSTSCATCGIDCKSRNKLFSHLKATGHAALK